MNDITQQAVLGAQGLQRKGVEAITAGCSPEGLLAGQSPSELLAEKTEPTTSEAFNLQPDQQFPEGFAVVYVEARGDRYFVRAYSNEKRPLYTNLASPPPVAFNEQMRELKLNPKQIRGRMREFSQKDLEARKIRVWLKTWLTDLRANIQENSPESSGYVVIHDRTDFEIPWEMLSLSGEKLLGSSVIVVRWQDVQVLDDQWNEEQFTPLETQKEGCSGGILAYTNTRDFQGVQNEVRVLKHYEALCFEDLNGFLHRLHQVSSPIGLVYIASHGFLSDTIFEAALGETDRKTKIGETDRKTKIGETDRKTKISFDELCGWDFEFLKNYRSIVFMNACHSGRLRWELQYTRQRIGLATFFLERGARGVIGTMGEIEDQYASQIAQQFLEEYKKEPSQSVAAILRRLREQALQNLQADQTKEENWRFFLFTFMYVYYGNPMTVLRLPSPGGQLHV